MTAGGIDSLCVCVCMCVNMTQRLGDYLRGQGVDSSLYSSLETGVHQYTLLCVPVTRKVTDRWWVFNYCWKIMNE